MRGPDTRRLLVGAGGLVAVLAVCVAYLFAQVLDLPLTGAPDRVTVELPRTGGLFEGSAVSYRGVRVGTVTAVRLTDDGVEAEVTLRDGARVPAAARARVRSLSPVGEQYLDLRPEADRGPWLADGDVLRADARDLPTSMAAAVGSLDRLLDQVDRRDVRVVLDELATATADGGRDLRTLLASSEELVTALDEAWPETDRLLRDGEVVGEVLAARRGELATFSRRARVFARWLEGFDPEFRRILRESPADLATIGVLVEDLARVLPPFLRRLVDLSDLAYDREPHLRELTTSLGYGAGRFASAFRDGWLQIDLLLQGQAQCRYDNPERSPMSVERRPLHRDGRCSMTDEVWRGAEHAPPPLAR